MQQNLSDPYGDIAWLMGRITRRWKATLDERLKFLGLTQARWHALLALSRVGQPITQRDLAERIGVEPSTLVRHIDALAAQGLIERTPDPHDRRANRVALTPAAAPLIAQIAGIAGDLRQDLLSGTEAPDMHACIGVLRQMADRLEPA